MSKIILYANGNGENHGCEALSRTITALFDKYWVVEYVTNSANDEKYGMNIVNQRKEISEDLSTSGIFRQILFKLSYKTGFYLLSDYLRFYGLIKDVKSNDICFSIGGDNYCYNDVTWLASLNYWLSRRKAKTVLLGVSIEPDTLKIPSILKDLKKYDLIIARESITYDALKSAGITNCVLLPDPAFLLSTQEITLPKEFIPNNTVGINISPMIMQNEKNAGIAYKNYLNLIKYVLSNTDMSVALIPHVVWERSDDRNPIDRLYNDLTENSRVCVVGDHNCMELKYLISQCRFFVGARTHATIAAYSMMVPTLVVGYSVKAKGIAKDLFGDYENYVIPVQTLEEDSSLVEAFKWMYANEQLLQQQLQDIIPTWIKMVKDIPDYVMIKQ